MGFTIRIDRKTRQDDEICTDFRRFRSLLKQIPTLFLQQTIISTELERLTISRSLKGYLAVTDRIKQISSFVTPSGCYQYCIMPFGIKKNSQPTCLRLIIGHWEIYKEQTLISTISISHYILHIYSDFGKKNFKHWERYLIDLN